MQDRGITRSQAKHFTRLDKAAHDKLWMLRTTKAKYRVKNRIQTDILNACKEPFRHGIENGKITRPIIVARLHKADFKQIKLIPFLLFLGRG